MCSSSRRIWLGGVALAIVASLVGASRPAFAAFKFEVVKGFETETRFPGPLVLGPDGALYGTSGGGLGNDGTVFRIDAVGKFSTLYVFSRAHVAGSGAGPSPTLTLGADGALYGTTSAGGTEDLGTLFKIDDAGSFTYLHSFGSADAHPSGLTLGSDGALYGVTNWTVFRVDASGAVTSLNSFGDAARVFPLTLGLDGALYGVVQVHGPNGQVDFTIFRIDNDGNVSFLHSWDGTFTTPLTLGSDGALYGIGIVGGRDTTVFRIDGDGNLSRLIYLSGDVDRISALAGLTRGSDGALYGTTFGSGLPGAVNEGSVFRVDGAGFTTVHVFSDANRAQEGAYPGSLSSLTVGGDGALYGTTAYGGAQDRGTVFRIDSAGNFETLHSFDDEFPVWGSLLAVGSNGALYGMRSGYLGQGTVYTIDRAGTFTSLRTFENGGNTPNQPLVVGGNGALYGSTAAGGTYEAGTLFEIDDSGAFRTLHSFGLYTLPRPLVLGSDGAVYGTTMRGPDLGLGHGPGSAFRVESDGSVTQLGAFSGIGFHPSALTLGSDGAFWGTTEGANLDALGAPGAIFRIDVTGGFSSMHVFSPYFDEGGGPSSLTLGGDGALYGTTGYGGPSNVGTIFRIDSGGSFTSLHAFDGSDGAGEGTSALVLGSDGDLYGATPSGGSHDLGSLFRIDAAGGVAFLHSFLGPDGAAPSTSLVVGGDGAMYGTTPSGGATGSGTIFRVDGSGAFASLHSFSGVDGANPSAALLLASDGALYGTTRRGGPSDDGTVFRVDRTGAFDSVHSFGGADGAHPSTALVEDSDGALYGTAPYGGPGWGGVVYRLKLPLTQTIGFDPLPDRTFGAPPFGVTATSSSGLPLSFTASGSCSVTGDQVFLTGAGLCTLTASQVGDADYEPAPEISQAFHVYSDFMGFLPPVESPPAVNRVNAGRVVPVAFEFAGDPGPGVLEGALVRRLDCDTLAPEGGFEPAGSPSAAALRGAASSGRYAFLWKTQKSWAGSCRELALELLDGSVHRAYFRFGDRPRQERRRD